MTADDTVFTSRIYLVKIKVGNDFNDEDLLWAVCHQGGDNVDLEDFKNIVTCLNQKGLWNPLLSDKRTTWKSLKTSADLKALGRIGSPILLLEGVSTFKQILDVAYKKGVLDDGKGWEILTAKKEELFAHVQPPRKSQTLEDAMKEADVPNPCTGGRLEDTVVKQSTELVTSMSSAGIDNELTQLTGPKEMILMDDTGTFRLPTPVPVTNGGRGGRLYSKVPGGYIPLDSLAGNDLEQLAVPGSSSSNVLVDAEGRPLATFEKHGSDDGLGTDQFSSGGVPFVENEVEIVGEGYGGAIGGGSVDAAFDPNKFSVDAIDNELALLEDASGGDLARQNARYKAVARTLRKSLAFACLTVQRMTKALDAKDMQLREVNSYSAADVTSTLRPELAKVGAVNGTCEKILKAVQDLDAKYSASMGAMTTDIRTVLAAVESNAALTENQSNNIVRHLGSFGMVDVGSTYDIPSGISSIHRLLNEEIAPVFRSGEVLPIYGYAKGVVDSNGAVKTVVDVASSGNIIFQNRVSPAQATVAAGQTQGSGSFGQVGGHVPATDGPNPVVYKEDGILRVPAAYSEQERFYMRVPGPRPDTTPTQPITQQQQFSIPPPPMKRMRFEGTTAVRSVFQAYAQPTQGSSDTRQEVIHQSHGQREVLLPRQTFQPKSLFSMPPPPIQQSPSVISQRGQVMMSPQVPVTQNSVGPNRGGADLFYEA